MIRSVLLLAIVWVGTASAQAPIRPANFAGTWVLDLARSDSSTFNPKSATWTVVQTGDSIILDRVTPAITQHAVYALSGAPRKNTLRLIGADAEATSMVTWSGAAMVVHTTSHPGDADLIQTDIWMLSADGKELRIKREASSTGTAIGAPTWVFVRKQ